MCLLDKDQTSRHSVSIRTCCCCSWRPIENPQCSISNSPWKIPLFYLCGCVWLCDFTVLSLFLELFYCFLFCRMHVCMALGELWKILLQMLLICFHEIKNNIFCLFEKPNNRCDISQAIYTERLRKSSERVKKFLNTAIFLVILFVRFLTGRHETPERCVLMKTSYDHISVLHSLPKLPNTIYVRAQQSVLAGWSHSNVYSDRTLFQCKMLRKSVYLPSL